MGVKTGITLYSGRHDHYSQRVRMALAVKQLDVDVIAVDLDQPPEDLASLNPYHSVPTLVDRDVSLYESRLILDYLEERFPHPPLWPNHPAARALHRQYAWRIDQDWSPYVDQIQRNAASAAQSRHLLRDSLITIAPIFADKPFFLSDELSYLDCLLAPILWRLPTLAIQLPERPCRYLYRYMERVFALPAFQASISVVERD